MREIRIKKVMHRIVGYDFDFLSTRTPQWLWYDYAWEWWVEPRRWATPYTTPLRILRWQD